MKIIIINIIFIGISLIVYIKLLKFYKERHFKWYKYCKKRTKLQVQIIALAEALLGTFYWLIGDKKILTDILYLKENNFIAFVSYIFLFFYIYLFIRYYNIKCYMDKKRR